jgi:RNA polymerase-interacting CarD/CdnL/TRCF family regulator
MEAPEPRPVLAEWIEILAESEAELAAGRTVDGEQLIRDLYAAADQLELNLGETEERPAPDR